MTTTDLDRVATRNVPNTTPSSTKKGSKVVGRAGNVPMTEKAPSAVVTKAASTIDGVWLPLGHQPDGFVWQYGPEWLKVVLGADAAA